MLLPADEVLNAARTIARRSWLTSDGKLVLDPQDRQCPMAGAFVLYMPCSDIACKPVSIYSAGRACLPSQLQEG